MERNREKLSIRTPSATDAIDHSIAVIRQAIDNQLSIRATYNRGQISLAPHILYERNGAPFVDGILLERNGVAPPEKKLGSYKLSGLRSPVVTSEGFAIDEAFAPDEPRYLEKVLARID